MTDNTLSSKILALRRYLPDPDRSGSMIYWEGDNEKNRGIYVDLAAIMGCNKEFIQKLKVGNKIQLGSLLSSILLWFLSDNIKIDEERLKRLFEGYLRSGFIDRLAGDDLIHSQRAWENRSGVAANFPAKNSPPSGTSDKKWLIRGRQLGTNTGNTLRMMEPSGTSDKKGVYIEDAQPLTPEGIMKICGVDGSDNKGCKNSVVCMAWKYDKNKPSGKRIVGCGKGWLCDRCKTTDNKSCKNRVSGTYKDGGYWEMECGDLGRLCPKCYSRQEKSKEKSLLIQTNPAGTSDKMTDIELKEMVDEMLGSDKTDDFVHKCPCNDCIGKDGPHGSHNPDLCANCGLDEFDHDRIYCKYCGSKLKKDKVGFYCTTPSCTWFNGGFCKKFKTDCTNHHNQSQLSGVDKG